MPADDAARSGRAAVLVEVEGPNPGRVLELRHLNTLGRSSRNQVVLKDDKVSRVHASIERTTDGYLISDKRSRQGTFVNGYRLSQATQLRSGDIIQIGSRTYRFEDRDGVAANPQPAPTAESITPTGPAPVRPLPEKMVVNSGSAAHPPAGCTDRDGPPQNESSRPGVSVEQEAGKPSKSVPLHAKLGLALATIVSVGLLLLGAYGFLFRPQDAGWGRMVTAAGGLVGSMLMGASLPGLLTGVRYFDLLFLAVAWFVPALGFAILHWHFRHAYAPMWVLAITTAGGCHLTGCLLGGILFRSPKRIL